MEVDDSGPPNPSDGEDENDTQPVAEDESISRKEYVKKHEFFGGSGGSLIRQDEGEDSKNVVELEDKDRESESVYDSPGGHRHTHRHKKFRRHHVEGLDRSGLSKRQKSPEDVKQNAAADMEDGEILEDGEIADDDDEEESKVTPPKKSPSGESTKSSPGSIREHRHRRERHQDEDKDRIDGNEEGEEESGDKSRKDKKRKKKSKKDRHERKDRDKKRKRHGREYKDPDRPDDQDMISFDKRSRSPPTTYDHSVYENPPSPYDTSSHHHSPSKKRNSPGQYEYHYDSPPGLYDSPSYDEDSEDGNHSLMRGMPSGYDAEYMDQDGQQQPHCRKRKAGHSSRNRRRSDEAQGPMQPRKKPLLEIPRHERPHCKFYMEGKCAKGNGCPFNHDFRPPRKPEICKFYLLSSCSKGEFCIYMHGDYPCKYFHTGADCYQGDKCKFSHDPLTDDTRPLLEKLLHADETDKPRPCLLGSPPRHLLEGGDPTKKIPSLFDIEVFPPGQNVSPRKPTPSSPSVRPSGFYQDAGASPQAPGSGPPGSVPQQHGSVPPVLNMIGAILRRAPPEVVARAGVPGPNQGPPPGMLGPRMQGPGMGPGPRGPFMGPGSSPDPRDNRGPRGPGPNFHDPRGPSHMDQGPPGGRGHQMDPRDPRAPGGPLFDLRDPRAQGIDPRGLPMDQRDPRSQGMDPRGAPMDQRDPRSQGMDHRGLPMDQRDSRLQSIDQRGPPGMDSRSVPPGIDSRGPPQGLDLRGLPPGDPRGPPPGMNQMGPLQSMDPRVLPPGMDHRGPSLKMDIRDSRAQGMDHRGVSGESRDPYSADQRCSQMDPRAQNMGPSGSSDARSASLDPRNQIKDSRDPRNQNHDTDLRDPRGQSLRDPRGQNLRDPRANNIDLCGPKEQRGLLPDPPNVQFDTNGPHPDSRDPRFVSQDSRNVPFIVKDPRMKMQNPRDPRSALGEKQDIHADQSPSHESEFKGSDCKSAETELTGCDPRMTNVDTKTSPKQRQEPDQSPKQDSAIDEVKLRQAEALSPGKEFSKSGSHSDAAVEMEYEAQESGQDNQDTQDLSQESLGDRKEDKDDSDRPVSIEILSHLPPTQRNLFMRIRQQQHNQDTPSDQGETTETSDDAGAMTQGPESQDMEDDDWYSSDEDGGDAPKLMDVLKNLNKQPVAQPATSSSTASTFNIMQMIQSIKNQAPGTDKTPPAKQAATTDSVKQIAPKRKSSTESRSSVPSKDIIRDYSATALPNSSLLNGAYPVIEAVLTSMTYRIRDFSLNDRKPYTSIPQSVDPSDASYQNDPRVQKYISRMGKVKTPLSSPLNGEKSSHLSRNANTDPRRARHLSIEEKAPAAKPQDPRFRRGDPRTQSDQANQPLVLSSLEKAVSEQIAKALDSRGSDPRLQRGQSNPNPVSHNAPVRPIKDPRLGRMQDQGGPQSNPRQDPRSIGRQHSHDGLSSRPSDPRSGPSFQNNTSDIRMPFEPRMGPGPGQRPPFDPRMPFHSRMPFGPGQGPRMGPISRMPFDPRMGPDQRLPFDPRMGPDQRMHNEIHPMSDQRSVGDTKSGPGSVGDPRLGGTGTLSDPRSVSAAKSDPRSASVGKNDPRLTTDLLTNDDPRSQGKQRTNSDPRSGNVDSKPDLKSSNTMPAALLEPPKLMDPRTSSSDNANTSESESGMSDSQSGDQSGKRFDYRNDPRFKRKPASDPSEKGILVKKFTGQRKSSMEYSSPLGIDDSKSESSGYNSYNRPNPNQSKALQKGNWLKTSNSTGTSGVSSGPASPSSGQVSNPQATSLLDLPQHTGGLDPPGIPSMLTPSQVPLPNEPPLKDLFKSIDPTASPFC